MSRFESLGSEDEGGEGGGDGRSGGGDVFVPASQGRRKKISKKVLSGKGAFETKDFFEFVQLKMDVKLACPLIALNIDPSRKKAPECRFDITSHEVRNLLLYLLENKFTSTQPKQWTMRNHPFVRNIVMIHASNAQENLRSLRFSNLEVATLRSSSSNTHVGTLPFRLIAIPSEELSPNQKKILTDREAATKRANAAPRSSPSSSSKPAANHHDPQQKLMQCVLTDGQLNMWGYPMPVPEDEVTEQAAKRQRIDPIPVPINTTTTTAATADVEEIKCSFDVVPSHALACQVIEQHSLCTVSVIMKGDKLAGFSNTQPKGWLGMAGYADTMDVPSSSHPLLALDCEMCMCVDGHQLARISVVAPGGLTLLDLVVRPVKPITNYLTQFSGMSADSFGEAPSSHVVTFEQAHVALLKLVSADTVLVGHSLQNDLKAIKIVHGRCIDTAIVFPHPRGFPYRMKLKDLTTFYLRRNIQEASSSSSSSSANHAPARGGPNRSSAVSEKEDGEEMEVIATLNTAPPPRDSTLSGLCTGGHDPVEDALASLNLAQLKILNGPSFGLGPHGAGQQSNQSNMRHTPLNAFLDPSVVSQIRYYNTGTDDGTDAMEKVPIQRSAHPSPGAALEALLRDLAEASHYEGTNMRLYVLTLDQAAAAASDAADAAATDGSPPFPAAYNQIRAALSSLPHASLVLTTAQRPTQAASALLQQKKACEAATIEHRTIVSVWNESMEAKLKAEVQACNLAAMTVEVVVPAS